MFLDILLLVAGLVLIVVGAELLTSWSVKIATHFGVPEIVVGLTIVAIGTSAPEIVVSITSAMKGQTQMAVGNVVGSNIFNALAIIGVTALIRPIPLSKSNVKKNIPSVILASLLLFITTLHVFGVESMPKVINRFEGIILMLAFALFMWYSIGGTGSKGSDKKEKPQSRKTNIALASLMVLLGLGGLVFGGDLFLENAIVLARSAGISEYVISATLMAAGTSLPELASCVSAARRGRSQLVLGNVIGSNVSNILLVLGLSATITPLDITSVSQVDISLVILSSILLIITPFTFKTAKVDRFEALIFVSIYLGYVIWLLR